MSQTLDIRPEPNEVGRFRVASQNQLQCAACKYDFKRNSSMKCPKCKGEGEPVDYIIDVRAFWGHGCCSCADFRCRVQPSFEKKDFSVEPCKHLVGTGAQGAFALFGQMVARATGEEPQGT